MPLNGIISPQGDSANTLEVYWKAAVIRDLRDGWGVEDIALRLSCGVSDVRAFVADLRKHGLLPAIYANRKREAQG